MADVVIPGISDRLKINTLMLIKTPIFCNDDCLTQDIRNY